MTVKQFTRRMLIKLLSTTPLFGLFRSKTKSRKTNVTPTPSNTEPNQRVSHWNNTHDRIWLGKQFWANPMENWQVRGGAAECHHAGTDRNIQLLTHQLTNPDAGFAMSVRIQQVSQQAKRSGAGFKIGIRSELNEYRSNCFAKNGIEAGLVGQKLTLGENSVPLENAPEEFTLKLSGEPFQGRYKLTLVAIGEDDQEFGKVSLTTASAKILGNVAVVSNYRGGKKKQSGAGKNAVQNRFHDWRVGGDAFTKTDGNCFGPIMWSMYTLSDSRSGKGFVLKISALTAPMGEQDCQSVELQIKQDGEWKSLGTSQLDTDAWVATFEIPNWDETVATPYRLVYPEAIRTERSKVEARAHSKTLVLAMWEGTIQANPTGRPLRVGSLTCQNDYAFPYQPVVDNLTKLAPDMLYFSGDQIYEGHGGFGIIRRPAEQAIICYLRKYYQFGWAFGDVMRDRPTVVLPDDHDVFQGNIWGEGGAPMDTTSRGASSNSGYIEPARMVNAVHKTCVSHHPAPYDPTTSKQEISVYYGDLVYGGVSFAILGDRQWKSGPKRVKADGPRADHISDPEFDTSSLDLPGLNLLGERQEAFLKAWAVDWRSHSMKVLLSQTVFAGVATNHGKFNGYLKGDLDSGGWPQSARNKAIEILRPSMALHICGDQHLATLTQYGTDEQRDSNWAYCTPAIAVGYPRWWRPDDVGMKHENRPAHGIENTGEYFDGFGNRVYVYAVGNPKVGKLKHRYELAHQKGSGLGLVTIDPAAKTYTLDAYRFLIDVNDGKPENQFPGWPVTIHQAENRGENILD